MSRAWTVVLNELINKFPVWVGARSAAEVTEKLRQARLSVSLDEKHHSKFGLCGVDAVDKGPDPEHARQSQNFTRNLPETETLYVQAAGQATASENVGYGYCSNHDFDVLRTSNKLSPASDRHC